MSGRPEKAGRRRPLFRILALLAGLGLALGAGEVAVRLAGVTAEARRHFRPGIYAPDGELGWRLLPGYQGAHMEHDAAVPTSTNPEGFRGPAWDAARAGAALRILALGDSCTFGRGVADDETWPAQLERRLRARGLDAAVWNAGVPGYDTAQQAALFRRLRERVRPHVVLVMWLPNDVLERSVELIPRTQVMDGQLVEDVEKYLEWRGRIDHTGLHRSALYRFLNTRLKLPNRRRKDWRVELTPESLTYSLEPLRQIAAGSAALGARTALVTLPRQEEVEDPATSIEHHAQMAAAAAALGFETLDLAAAWRAGGPRAGRYLTGDTVHPTGAGYAEVAEALATLEVFTPPTSR